MSQNFYYPSFGSSSLPTGAATAANQVLEIADLDAIKVSVASLDTKQPTVGQKTMAASSPVVIASDQSPIAVTGSFFPTTQDVNVFQINGVTPLMGNGATGTGSLRVTIASDNTAFAVNAVQSGTWNINNISGTISLPTGAATEATLASMSAKLPSVLGQTTMAASLSVAIASNQSAIPVTVASVPLPTGAATEATLAAMSAKLPAALGAQTIAASMAVNIASNQTVPVSGPLTDTQLRATAVPVSLTSTTVTGTVAVTQSGTWTVQPGNTPNTTAWLVKELTSSTATITSVNGSASSVSLLASNSSRLGATFYNDSAAILYLKLGTTASTTSYTVQLNPNAYYELPTPHLYTGAIDGIWASATGAVRITELS